MRHETDVRAQGPLLDRPRSYQAYCTCGWQGRDLERRRDAMDDGDEHTLAMCQVEEEPR